ncbi:class IIb bacteriocin, lactobin A/cerein 7B family [Sphingobacterium sp. UBA5670]|uniref:class IIb bacteriocin, lactobin A/cerein 7B family n=1 Tax=Sphingobacterium sp. UBA5670 TaxID=1947502 RepID=UPI0025F16125|nr:class IIb bacteriocin, lactobin A/cerein 7B family [Sphingobacterium sp. UBA5670]
MFNVEINNLGLVEMDSKEMKNINGGISPVLAAFLVAVAWSAWENVGDIRDGWSDGGKGKPRY